MPDSELEIVITAKDQAGKVLQGLSAQVKRTAADTDKLSGSTTKSGLSLTKLAASVGLGTLAYDAFRGALRFASSTIKQSIEDAKDAEASQVKVNAILETLTGNYKEHAQTVEEAARAALQLGFDDEDASESMAKLLQVTGDTTTAQEAMTNAMDLARFKGIGLTEASQAITLALNGNVRLLKQLGIEIPDNASKTEILGLVMERVGGQAEAFGNTAAGAQERFQNAMENTREEVGAVFLPMFTEILNSISNFVTSEQFTRWIKNVGVFLGTLKTDIEKVYIPLIRDQFAGAFDALSLSINGTSHALPNFKGQFTGMDLILSPVIGLFAAIEGTLKGARKAAESLATYLVGPFVSAANKVGDAFGAFDNAAAKVTNGALNFLLPGRAVGGSVSAGQPYMVGENGPELMVPDSAGRIIPNQTNNSSVTVNVAGSVSSQSDIDAIIDGVNRVLGRRQELAKKGAY